TGSAVIAHSQGDVVDDTLQTDLSPGPYPNVIIQCGSYYDKTFLDSFTASSILIVTETLDDGLLNTQYNKFVQEIGGTTPLVWDIISGSLPSGLSLNLSTGEIYGTPTTIETASFTVQVADANNNTATKDLSITIHGNTPVGSDVSVGPFSGVTLTFSQVTAEGQTTIASSSSGMTPPSGFKLGNPPTYYSISTTALFNPPIEVCLSWVEGQFNNENNLKLWHLENGTWVNITTSLDTTNNIICGQVSSFSEFGLFEDITIDHVIDEIKSFNLEPDIEQGLFDKLNAAKSAIERGQNKTARNILKAFINLVNAQEGKKISNDQANILRTDAQALINSLGGNLLSTIFKWVLFGWLDKFVNAMLSMKI
ncbi:MAG: Ig domain-containing protein, partial [bacterium]|nr:Ig domain-containing protein [bacterium]